MRLTRRELLASPVVAVAHVALAQGDAKLENESLAARFDRKSGNLVSLRNKLTGESYGLRGDEIGIETTGLRIEFRDLRVEAFDQAADRVSVKYRHARMEIEVVYRLGPKNNFVEKQVTLNPPAACDLTHVVLATLQFSGSPLELVSYRYPNYDRLTAQHGGRVQREPGTEPIKTYFGRSRKGGLFTGLAMPFDSSQQDQKALRLAYAPNLRLKAGGRLECEPMYLGVYSRNALDQRAADWRPSDSQVPAAGAVLPLPSESAAMVAMTSAILGPRRHPTLVAMACGWHSEFEQFTFDSDEGVTTDMKSLDFLQECGVDWMTDSHPWAGETEKVNALEGDQRYELGPRVRAFLDHARKVGVKVVQWPTMNNTHPWSRQGKPFWQSKTEWLRVPVPRKGDTRLDKARYQPGNCLANTPFFEWLERVNFQALDSGYYEGWCMDGDFWGWGGYFDSTVPVECLSKQHDHLAPDSNYGCQRALDRLIADIRKRWPKIFVVMCRPPMDLGVWSQRNVDACFTLIESGSGTSNIAGGDEIRTASRIRLHHHFFPHYIDWPLLFPSYAGIPGKSPRAAKPRPWPSANLDYILLSALSCAPNLLLYLPTKTGIPEQDKAAIRKWLGWGRQNFDYLKVRRDLPDWPGPGRIDGSAHVLEGKGFVFLFNPNRNPLPGRFRLTAEELGLPSGGRIRVAQEYPASERRAEYRYGEAVEWAVPAETAVVLRLERLS